MKNHNLRKYVGTAILSAIGLILMLIEFPVSFIMPSFIKLDFSELPALIASFAYGPVFGILVCFIKNLLHLFVGSTFGVGELSNFLLGAIFTGVAGLVYKKMNSRKGALIGCLVGAISMAFIGIFTNYFIVYPAYVNIYGMPMEAILGAYQVFLSSIKNLWQALIIFNTPFNILKGVIDSIICFIIYKKLSPILKGKSIDK